MQIKEWQRQVHVLAVDKGWWEEPVNIPEKLALIHSEISEALEDYRDGPLLYLTDGKTGAPIGFAIELADAVIRIMDLCEKMNIDLESAIARKHDYNKTRSYRHGGKRA